MKIDTVIKPLVFLLLQASFVPGVPVTKIVVTPALYTAKPDSLVTPFKHTMGTNSLAIKRHPLNATLIDNGKATQQCSHPCSDKTNLKCMAACTSPGIHRRGDASDTCFQVFKEDDKTGQYLSCYPTIKCTKVADILT